MKNIVIFFKIIILLIIINLYSFWQVLTVYLHEVYALFSQTRYFFSVRYRVTNCHRFTADLHYRNHHAFDIFLIIQPQLVRECEFHPCCVTNLKIIAYFCCKGNQRITQHLNAHCFSAQSKWVPIECLHPLPQMNFCGLFNSAFSYQGTNNAGSLYPRSQ